MALIGSLSTFYDVDFLCIGGGGGSGTGGSSGGGGAGGYRVSYASEVSGGLGGANEVTPKFTKGAVYIISVATAMTSAHYMGRPSSISGVGVYIECLGGGAGGSRHDWPAMAGTGSAAGWNGGIGGCGGGGGSTSQNVLTDDDYCYGGPGTLGQGYPGGAGMHNPGQYEGGGGGGGASERGQYNQSGQGGNGGAGLSSSITGSAVTRAGGGAASGNSSGTGGAGGGGNGGGNAGAANTGGGGGAANASGGSGVVILRMTTANYSGTTTGSPTASTDGSDTILVFNASGTYTA